MVPTFNSCNIKKQYFDAGDTIQSSLVLQIALYFNVRYFPVWILVSIYNLDAIYIELSDIYKLISVAILLIIIILESVRLYLGYLGNLGERIPELTSFWLISTLLQFPLEIFLVIDGNSMNYFDKNIFNWIALTFLIIEILIGLFVLKQFADHHAKRFYIAQMYGIENKMK